MVGLSAGACGTRPWPLALGLGFDPVGSGELADVGVGEGRVFGDVGGPFARLECGEDGGYYVLPGFFVGLFRLPVAGGALVELRQGARVFRHRKNSTGTLLRIPYSWANVGIATEFRCEDPEPSTDVGVPVASTLQVSTREAATAYRVSTRTIRRWAANGKLNAVKTCGRWQIAVTADLDGFKPQQVDKARELIEQGAILPTSRQGLYTAVSSDGTTTYLVHASGCTCPAGQRGKYLCYHRTSVAILSAAAAVQRAA